MVNLFFKKNMYGKFIKGKLENHHIISCVFIGCHINMLIKYKFEIKIK